MAMKVHLLRHARPQPPTVATAEVALSAQGLADAERIVSLLASLDIRRIVSSPYRRAIETVEPFAASTDIVIERDERLRERVMPLAESPEMHFKIVRASFEDSSYAPESGETFKETTERVLDCLRELVLDTPSGLLLVGHGQCLTQLLKAGDGAADYEFWRSMPTPALLELTTTDDGAPASFRELDF